MYFINIKELKKDIIEKKFGEKDRFIYILLYVGIYALLLEFLISFHEKEVLTIYDYIASVCSVIITFVGTYFIYKVNGGNDGEDFAGKYFSITWVIGWRVILVSIPILFIFSIIGAFQEAPSIFDELIDLIWSIGIEFFIFFLSYKAVLEIKEQEKV